MSLQTMRLAFLLLACGILLSTVSAWVSPAFSHKSTCSFARHATLLHDANSRDDVEYLPLSTSDLSRLSTMRNRHKTLPLLIADSILPGQILEFGSSDPKFVQLLKHVLASEEGEFGMIGLNPLSGTPLNLGTTVSLTENKVNFDEKGVFSVSVKGKRRFEVEREPWLDESGSFYLADVEIVEGREEPPLDDAQKTKAERMSNALNELVEEWLLLVVSKGKSDMESMDKRVRDIGPMPDDIGDRAFWIASLVNSNPALGVCMEIRPAMLAAKNDYDRIMLATAALTSSIDQLKGET